MSLSRPAKFPLLKLPWLCIKCVLHNSDEFDLIYFASISNRTRRIVQHSKYPLKEIDVYPNSCGSICIRNGRAWIFKHDKYRYGVPLVLKRESVPLRTCKYSDKGCHLESYTDGNKLDALKMGIDFVIDLFGCTIGQVFVTDQLSELYGLPITSARELVICGGESLNVTDLKSLLENVNITDEYRFHAQIPEDFYCDPQIFKCRRMYFSRRGSADWVTSGVLCQLDVPILNFLDHRFSAEDIVSYITQWFNSENKKLEWARFEFRNAVSQEDLKIDHLNPMPFCEKRRNRYPLGGWKKTDMSSGKDILRQDGLLATVYVVPTCILFHIWHKRFPDTV